MGELKWWDNPPNSYFKWVLRDGHRGVAGLRLVAGRYWKAIYANPRINDEMLPSCTTEEEAKALTLVKVRMGG